MLSILFAFAAAFASALNMVVQHVASTAAPARVKGWRLAFYLVRNPLWLFGVAAVVASFVLQAVALYNGRLSVVQSILVTELVFALVIGRVWLRRAVRAAAWISASLTSAGLGLFLAMSEPKGGHPSPTTQAWLPVLLIWGGIAAACAVLAGRGSPVRRAALYASASAIVSALLATFLKASTDTLATTGIIAVLSRGEVYGLIAAGIAGTVLTQAALHYGPLAVSQPIMVIINPFVSIILSIWIYGEHFSGGAAQVAFGALGFAALVVGVVCLARTAPSFAAASESAPSAEHRGSTPSAERP
jgi:drug/metabolite transporter (DMT)-like permease